MNIKIKAIAPLALLLLVVPEYASSGNLITVRCSKQCWGEVDAPFSSKHLDSTASAKLSGSRLVVSYSGLNGDDTLLECLELFTGARSNGKHFPLRRVKMVCIFGRDITGASKIVCVKVRVAR